MPTPAETLAEWQAGLPHTRSVWTDRLAQALEEALELLDAFVGDQARAYYKSGGHVTVHVTDAQWRRACVACGGRGLAGADREPELELEARPGKPAAGRVPTSQIGPGDPWPEGFF